jgi:hypothetical protein
MKYISNYEKFNEEFLDLFKGKKTEEKPTQPVKKQEVESTNPDHQLHKEGEVFNFNISDFAKFVKFCKEKKIYDLILAADADKVLLGDNMKNETAWKNSFFDKDGDFNIIFTGNEPGSAQTGRDEIYYARVDANNSESYPLAVYDEELKKYVEY